MPKPYYQDGYVTIYHGDSREIVPLLSDESFDLVLTDPPYGHNNNNGDLISRREAALGKGDYDPGRDNRPIANDDKEANKIFKDLLKEFYRLLKPGCCCCCCCAGGGPDPQFARWSIWMDEVFQFKQMLIWDKGGLGMGWHYRRSYETILVGEKPGAACNWHGGHSASNVLRHNKIIPQKNDHPTPKPVSLMEELIGNHTATGEIILDPFMGAGTTLRAAKNFNRKAIGIEIEEKYCEMAAKRMGQEVLTLDA